MTNLTPLHFRINPHKVYPDGVDIYIFWKDIEIGDSVFIPAINHPRLRMQVKRIADTFGIVLESRERIEAGKWGLRFWRVR